MHAGEANGTDGSSLSRAKADLLATLPDQGVQPLWTVMHAMVPPKPTPKAQVAVWRYEKLRPLLLEAGGIVSSDEAERRVLMLVNPALNAPFTTDTVYAGLQLINPGETAAAHRHQAFALRFIIEGSGGYTAVEGQKIHMQQGDVILTPQWQWHDHGHEGKGPMIWLDGLDLPLYHHFPTHFAEPYQKSQYPSQAVDSSLIRFEWADIKHKLDSSASDWSQTIYRRKGGEYLSKTLGAHAEHLKAGKESPSRHDTCSYVYHVQSGSGKTTIELYDGSATTVEWTKSDTFAVPAWSTITHSAAKAQDAYLFALSDMPLLESLSMYLKG